LIIGDSKSNHLGAQGTFNAKYAILLVCRIFRYAGAWGWSSTNLDFYLGTRALREAAPAVLDLQLPQADDVTMCPGQWPWAGVVGSAGGHRRSLARGGSDSVGAGPPSGTSRQGGATMEGWSASEYLERKLAPREVAAVASRAR